MGRPAHYEANSYFYTVIPDVLLYEILADLKLGKKGRSRLVLDELVGLAFVVLDTLIACPTMP